jgi:hypothetical protein
MDLAYRFRPLSQTMRRGIPIMAAWVQPARCPARKVYAERSTDHPRPVLVDDPIDPVVEVRQNAETVPCLGGDQPLHGIKIRAGKGPAKRKAWP